MRTHIIALLVKKDFRDLGKNMSILPVVFLAPLLAYFVGIIDKNSNQTLSFWLLYGIVMVGLMLPGFTVAEEKEKGTLDSLLVSPATHHEIIAGKVLFTTVLVFMVSIVTLAPNGGLTGNQLLIWLTVFIGAAFFIQVGLMIGLFTNSQIAAGAFMTPAMLFFIMTPMFIPVLPPIIRFFFEHMPNTAFLKIVETAYAVGTFEEVWIDLVTLLIWNGIAYIFTLWGIRHQFQ